MKQPISAPYTKKGHEALAEEVDGLSKQLTPKPDGNAKFTRWDGFEGTATEIMNKCLAEVKEAASEPRGGDWVLISDSNNIVKEYHVSRTQKGWGNKFFRISATINVPPQLFAVGLLEPTILGSVDHTIRHLRVLYDFPDGRTRLVTVVAEIGPRPLCYDRDECALTTYMTPEISGDGSWWQVSCTVPKHLPSPQSAVRNYTMYWGYKLEPFKDPTTGQIFTKLVLITQTEVFGWLPKMVVNRFIPIVLADYVRTLEAYLKDMLDRGAPARLLVESFGLTL